MSPKIRSALVATTTHDRIVGKYEEIYQDDAVWLRTSLLGRTRLVRWLARADLRGARLLDVGCGGGRMPLLSSDLAREAVGIDPAGAAVKVARGLAQALGLRNVRFQQAGLEDLPATDRYDVMTILGVIEHVEDPSAFLVQAARRLKPGGLIVLEVPSFQNFRGDVYMALLSLFGLPMSLADLHQIFPADVERMSAKARLRLERTVGYHYNLGWADKGVADMLKRVPAALRDAKLEKGRDLEAFEAWMRARLRANRALIERLTREGVLRRIPQAAVASQLKGERLPPALRKAFRSYIEDDPSIDPCYSETAPYNELGGGTIFFLRKA